MNTIRCEYQPEERAIVLPAHFKRDEGQALEVYGMPFDDGQKVRVAFIREGDDRAVPVTGVLMEGSVTVAIPDEMFEDTDGDGGYMGRLRAYVALVDDDSVTTIFYISIPLYDAPENEDENDETAGG